MTLQQRADRLLRDALEVVPAGESTRKAREVLEQQRVKLAAPLRIALAGRVSAGKSTLVNALVKEPVAVTGKGPITMAVSVLQYADTPKWTVHYTDKSTEDVPNMDELAAFTARAEHQTARPSVSITCRCSAPIPACGSSISSTPPASTPRMARTPRRRCGRSALTLNSS